MTPHLCHHAELVPNPKIFNHTSQISSRTSISSSTTPLRNIRTNPTLPSTDYVQHNFSSGSEVIKKSCDCTRQSCTSNFNSYSSLPAQNEHASLLYVQVESLREVLGELIKDKNVGTQLLLIGQQPPGTNALEAIRQLITEKLELIDLEHKIQQAYQTEYGIFFEMTSSIEKLRILSRARNRLNYSNYQITDFNTNQMFKNFHTTETKIDEKFRTNELQIKAMSPEVRTTSRNTPVSKNNRNPEIGVFRSDTTKSINNSNETFTIKPKRPSSGRTNYRPTGSRN